MLQYGICIELEAIFWLFSKLNDSLEMFCWIRNQTMYKPPTNEKVWCLRWSFCLVSEFIKSLFLFHERDNPLLRWRNPRNTSHWSTHRLFQYRGQKDPEYYSASREEYNSFISGNDLIAVLSVMKAVTTKTIYLLATNVKSQKFIAAKGRLWTSPWKP